MIILETDQPCCFSLDFLWIVFRGIAAYYVHRDREGVLSLFCFFIIVDFEISFWRTPCPLPYLSLLSNKFFCYPNKSIKPRRIMEKYTKWWRAYDPVLRTHATSQQGVIKCPHNSLRRRYWGKKQIFLIIKQTDQNAPRLPNLAKVLTMQHHKILHGRSPTICCQSLILLYYSEKRINYNEKGPSESILEY